MNFFERTLSFLGYTKSDIYGPSVLAGLPGITTAGSPRPSHSNLYLYLNRYADEAWVFSCIKAIQTKAAGVPLKVYKVINGKKTEQPDHPLKKLLDTVNSYMDGYALLESLHGYKELAGNAFWLLDRMVDGLPTEICPLNPIYMKPLVSKKEGVVAYEYRINGQVIDTFAVEEILHFKTWNPGDPFWGLPTLSAGRDGADMMKSGDQFNIAFFKNSAEAGGFLTTDKPMNQESIDRIKTAWAKNHQGARKAHKIEILSGGLDYKPTTISHKDMLFPELKRMSREEVLSCFQMPPVMVGVFDEANYSNANVQRRIFWQDCIMPRLKAIESVINERLAKPYGDVVVEHDTTGIEDLKEDAKVKAERDEIHTRSGIKTINEVRAELNLKPVSWGDTWNAPFGLAPIDGPKDTDPVEDDKPDPEKPEEETDDEETSKTAKPEEAVDKGLLVRNAVWLVFKGQTESWERRWFPVLRKLFSEQEKEVIRKLHDADFETLGRQARLDRMKNIKQSIGVVLFDRGQARKVFQKEGRRLIEYTLAAKANAQLDAMDLDVQFNVTNPKTIAWISEKAFKFSEEVNRATEDALREELIEAIKEGESIKNVEKRIEKVFDIARGSRTKTIARTEVISASNRGAYDAYEQAGVKQLEWVSSRDSLVRDSHQIDGERTGVGLKFSNGLMHPGDPQGDAAEVINCRCTTAPIMRRDE